MSATEQTLKLLTEIRDGIREGNALLRQFVAGGGASGSGGAVASDRELDSKYGDPEVRVSKLRDWTGLSMKGRKYSQCPAEFLDQLAELHEYSARKADEKGEKTDKGKPVGDFRRRDARLARGWAQRVREGKGKAAPASSSSDDEWGQDSGYGSGNDW